MKEEKTFFSESKLVGQLQQKDSKAFEYLYDHYAPNLYGVVLRIVGIEEIAQDVLQESFVKVWHNIGQYDVSKGKLFTWMLNITRNTAIDKLRSKEMKATQNNKTLDTLQARRKSDESTGLQTEFIGLRETLSRLKEEHKIIIEMAYFEGHTQAEISEQLQIPLGTIKTRSRDALKQLRTLLTEKNHYSS